MGTGLIIKFVMQALNDHPNLTISITQSRERKTSRHDTSVFALTKAFLSACLTEQNLRGCTCSDPWSFPFSQPFDAVSAATTSPTSFGAIHIHCRPGYVPWCLKVLRDRNPGDLSRKLAVFVFT